HPAVLPESPSHSASSPGSADRRAASHCSKPNQSATACPHAVGREYAPVWLGHSCPTIGLTALLPAFRDPQTPPGHKYSEERMAGQGRVDSEIEKRIAAGRNQSRLTRPGGWGPPPLHERRWTQIPANLPKKILAGPA